MHIRTYMDKGQNVLASPMETVVLITVQQDYELLHLLDQRMLSI